MTTYPAPNPPYLGPANHYSPGGNKPIDRITIHSTVGPTKAGSARGIAAYFRTTTRYASAHYVVDAAEVVQVVYDGDTAYHAPPNAHSIGVEMCDNPHPTSKDRWADKDHQALLTNTARLVAELCLAYNVPPRWRSYLALRMGLRGITSHASVSKAWGQTSHWDPGCWPRRRFMREVRRQVRAIKRAS